MVQFQKPKKIYNDRRVPFGRGPSIVSGDYFAPVASPAARASNDKRNGGHAAVGSYMPFGPLPNGNINSGVRPGGFPISCSPLPPYLGAPHSQPYAIPCRGGVHGPIGSPQGPQSGNRGFVTGHGSVGGPIGGHLPHQGSQHAIGSLVASYNFPGVENRATQQSARSALTQSGLMDQLPTQGSNQILHDSFPLVGMSQDFLGDDFKSQGSHVAYNVPDFNSQDVYGGDYVTQGSQGTYTSDVLNQNSQSGYSQSGTGNGFVSQVQDYMPHGSHGLFTQVAFGDCTQGEPTSAFFAVGGALQSQGQMSPMYVQPFTQYPQALNPQAMQQQQAQQQGSKNQGFHYNN